MPNNALYGFQGGAQNPNIASVMKYECISLLRYLVSLTRAKRKLFGMDILHVALTAVKLGLANISLIYW